MKNITTEVNTADGPTPEMKAAIARAFMTIVLHPETFRKDGIIIEKYKDVTATIKIEEDTTANTHSTANKRMMVKTYATVGDTRYLIAVVEVSQFFKQIQTLGSVKIHPNTAKIIQGIIPTKKEWEASAASKIIKDNEPQPSNIIIMNMYPKGMNMYPKGKKQ